jgi:hypothetical protein
MRFEAFTVTEGDEKSAWTVNHVIWSKSPTTISVSLMMDTEKLPEILACSSKLTRLVTKEYFVTETTAVYSETQTYN